MKLRLSDIQSLQDALYKFKVLFLESSVTLSESSTVLIVPVYVTQRQASGADLTSGMPQYATLALILKKEWDELSPGRSPRRGDVVEYQSRRYSIEEVASIQPADVDMIYRCRVLG